MVVPTNEELTYEQENRSYDLITRSIVSFGEKYQRVFTINSALLGILFVVTTFIMDYFSKHPECPAIGKLILGVMLITGIIALIFFFLALWKFLPISKTQGYKAMNSYKFYKEYHNDTTTPFIEAFTIKINSLNEKNLEKFGELKWHYERSLLYTNIGIAIFFIFIFLSIVLFLVISEVVNV
jgi:hypothetical protein